MRLQAMQMDLLAIQTMIVQRPPEMMLAQTQTTQAPCNLPLLPGSLCIDGFHVLVIGLPQGVDKAEWSNEQTHQRSSQVSNTRYQADSPKRHVTVILMVETKRIPFLVIYKIVHRFSSQTPYYKWNIE